MEAYVPEDRVGARNIVTSRYQRVTRVIQIIGNSFSFILMVFYSYGSKDLVRYITYKIHQRNTTIRIL